MVCIVSGEELLISKYRLERLEEEIDNGMGW